MRAGETVQLQCLAHGTPPLTFQWSRVGGSLPARATARNELLRFESVAPEDSGRYRCQVTNKVGSAEAFAQVFVQGEQPWLRRRRRGSYEKNIPWILGWGISGSWEGRHHGYHSHACVHTRAHSQRTSPMSPQAPLALSWQLPSQQDPRPPFRSHLSWRPRA